MPTTHVQSKHQQRTYTWISAWFLITAPIMIWDALYCLLRPRSMVGGDLHWLFRYYELYQEVDYVYGVKAFENGEGFAGAAAILNLLEISANLLYLLATHIFPHPLAPLIGYTGATMTLSKTVLYVAQEYFCGWCATGHNIFWVALGAWIVPNLIWTLLSSLTMYQLGSDIFDSLYSPTDTLSTSTALQPSSPPSANGDTPVGYVPETREKAH